MKMKNKCCFCESGTIEQELSGKLVCQCCGRTFLPMSVPVVESFTKEVLNLSDDYEVVNAIEFSPIEGEFRIDLRIFSNTGTGVRDMFTFLQYHVSRMDDDNYYVFCKEDFADRIKKSALNSGLPMPYIPMSKYDERTDKKWDMHTKLRKMEGENG